MDTLFFDCIVPIFKQAGLIAFGMSACSKIISVLIIAFEGKGVRL